MTHESTHIHLNQDSNSRNRMHVTPVNHSIAKCNLESKLRKTQAVASESHNTHMDSQRGTRIKPIDCLTVASPCSLARATLANHATGEPEELGPVGPAANGQQGQAVGIATRNARPRAC